MHLKYIAIVSDLSLNRIWIGNLHLCHRAHHSPGFPKLLNWITSFAHLCANAQTQPSSNFNDSWRNPFSHGDQYSTEFSSRSSFNFYAGI